MRHLLKSQEFWNGFATVVCFPFTVFKIPPAPRVAKSNVGSCRWTDVGSSAGMIRG